VVLDNLIARKEVPIMAAVFVDPGSSIAKYKGTPVRDNRSEEYDTLCGAALHRRGRVGDRGGRYLIMSLFRPALPRY
jgi:hypothetical protein